MSLFLPTPVDRPEGFTVICNDRVLSAEKKVRTLYGVKVEEYKTERGTFRQIGGRIWTPDRMAWYTLNRNELIRAEPSKLLCIIQEAEGRVKKSVSNIDMGVDVTPLVERCWDKLVSYRKKKRMKKPPPGVKEHTYYIGPKVLQKKFPEIYGLIKKEGKLNVLEEVSEMLKKDGIIAKPKIIRLPYYPERSAGEKATAMWEVYPRAEDTRKLHRLLKSSLGRGFPGYKGVLHELCESVKKTERISVLIDLSPKQLDELKRMHDVKKKLAGSKVSYLYIDVDKITDEDIAKIIVRSQPVELARKKEEYEKIGLEPKLNAEKIRIYSDNRVQVSWLLRVNINTEVAKKIYQKKAKNMKVKTKREGD